MARHHSELLDAGARVVGISVDPPERNAAMVEKLRLPYPLLADPGGERAIKPYDVWHEGQSFARPAVIALRPDGSEIVRQVGEDFADRLPEESLVESIRGERLSATTQPPPALGSPAPGPKAVELSWLPWYLRGAKMATIALSGRVSGARGDARAMQREYDRFLEALQHLDDVA